MPKAKKSPYDKAVMEPADPLEPEVAPPEEDEQALQEQLVEAPAETTHVNPEDVTVWESGQDLLDAQEQTNEAYTHLHEHAADFHTDTGPLPPDEAYQAAVATGLSSAVEPDTFQEVYESWGEGGTALPDWQVELNEAAAKWIDAQNDPDLSLADKYDALTEYGDTARGILAEQDLDTTSEHFAALKANTQGWLNELNPSELREVAHHAGFQHPMLVSGGNPHDMSGKNALAFAVDPAYDPHLVQKQKIQDSALARYHKLKDGEVSEIKGVTLADVDADAASHGAGAAVPAAAGLPPVIVDQAKFDQMQATHAKYGDMSYISPHHKLEAIKHNFEIAAAAPTEGITQEQLDALTIPQSNIGHPHFYDPSHYDELTDLVGVSHDQFAVGTVDQKQLLTNPWADSSEVETAKASMATKLEQAHDTIATGVSNAATWQAHKDDKLGQGLTTAQAKQLVENWGAVSQNGLPSNLQAYKQAMADAGLDSTAGATPPNGTQLRAWMKNQPLKELRTLADECGMDPTAAKKGTRAQVQNYLIHKSKGKDKVAATVENQALVHAAKPKKTPPAPSAPHTSPVAPVSSASPTPTATAKSPSVSKPVVASAKAVGEKIVLPSYKKQLDDLSSHLSKALAAEQDIPKRNEQAVSGLKFTQNPAHAPAGGSHTVVGYEASDGTAWFAKPYGASGGAPRAAAEAVASQAKEALGLEVVPVYHMKVEGKDVAMQPLVSDASTLSGTPVQQMSQADVDTVVRHQVGDWLIGDHDGNEGNWMRTDNGAMFRIDHGQAFKFYGADRLSTDFEPNGNYGTPVFQQVMKSQKDGHLPSGARVNPGAALGVIERAEKIPDSQWRDMMRPVAEAGAGNGEIAWVPRMRKAAAKKHGVAESAVSKDQVVDAFLDHAVERKNGAREGFLALFRDAGLSGGALGAQKD